MQHTIDLNRCHGGALKRREQHATKRITEGQAEAPFEGFRNYGGPTFRYGALNNFKFIRFNQFLPIFLDHGSASILQVKTKYQVPVVRFWITD